MASCTCVSASCLSPSCLPAPLPLEPREPCSELLPPFLPLGFCAERSCASLSAPSASAASWPPALGCPDPLRASPDPSFWSLPFCEAPCAACCCPAPEDFCCSRDNMLFMASRSLESRLLESLDPARFSPWFPLESLPCLPSAFCSPDLASRCSMSS